MARVELENHIVRSAKKISEPHTVHDRSRDETIKHFLTLVQTNSGVILRFEDAGSRAVRIRTEWKVTATKNDQVLCLGKLT